jgi:hypothetical protein
VVITPEEASMTDDLIAWLNVQLDTDERLARDCIAEVGSWRVGRPYPDDYYLPDTPPEPREVADQDAFPHYPYGSGVNELAFMADAGHPERVLADCESKRRMITQWLQPVQLLDPPDAIAVSMARSLLATMAEPYAKLGRPGYQESWRP